MGWIVYPLKYANVGHWRLPNDFWGHLWQNYFKRFFQFCIQFLAFLAHKNANFDHWTAQMENCDPSSMHILHILVMEGPRMTVWRH